MNAAVLLFAACLTGADPVAATPPASPVPSMAKGSDCCGHASTCGASCDFHGCCLLTKIKEKLCCFSLCDKGCNKGCSFNLCDKGNSCVKGCAPTHNTCDKGCKKSCNLCDKGHATCAPTCSPCPKPACNPCPKPACNPCPKPECPKPVCCKVEPECHKPCFKICWEPGYCLHKCKEKLCGLCSIGSGCHGGCGTACTPNACGSTTIPPATTAPAPKAMPDPKKIPEKVGSAYPMVRPNLNGDGSVPRTIDLTSGSPF